MHIVIFIFVFLKYVDIKSMYLLIFLLFFSVSFGETLYLKETIYLTNSKTILSNIFKNNLSLTNEIMLSSRFYNSTEILRFINSEDVVIAGKGINIKIVKPYSVKKIKDFIENYGYEILDIKFPEGIDNIYIINNITNILQEDNLISEIELCYFKSECGILTNLTITSKIKKIEENQKLYLKDIMEKNATLYYKKRNINIKLKVKIIKKLENNFYLVENYNGKILKIRAEDE
ncbi:MAG: hypothetical protein N2258_05365 [Brevinematales bacterium]|nr:hypothetical protein [Brevinematales bacterium]